MKVLIVEDDIPTADYIEKGLREAGHSLDRSTSGKDALLLLTDSAYDAVVLDRMLPELDGLSVLKMLRAAGNDTPVLLLSALGQTDHRVEGLQSGADDYLSKPFAFTELLARLEALQRRRLRETPGVRRLVAGSLELDLITRKACRGNREVDLLPREFQILEYLMRNKGRIVTRTMLLENVWDYRFDPQTNVTDVHISRLRKKIDAEGEPQLIETVRGAGYRMSA
ncbi:MAG: response regulator transcription factor [Pseudomonadota bacterium]